MTQLTDDKLLGQIEAVCKAGTRGDLEDLVHNLADMLIEERGDRAFLAAMGIAPLHMGSGADRKIRVNR